MTSIHPTPQRASRTWARLCRFTALACLWTVPVAKANEVMRPTKASQLLIGTQRDVGYRVTTARVVTFNRPALERDFPRLRGQTDAYIRAWILRHFAYVNAHQLALNGIRNSPILVDKNDQVTLWIPPGVGRGGMVEVEGEGLVDLKATGNSSWNAEMVHELVTQAGASPKGLDEVLAKDHSNGLETYSLATAEYLRQMEIQQDYNHRNAVGHGEPVETVESYFLIDYGFDILYPGGKVAAFMYGRQAQLGRTADNRPLKDEIYVDKGQFQASYFGARIDFGGARTRSESAAAYHDRARALAPEQMGEFIDSELKRIGHSPSRTIVVRVSNEEMTQLLSVRPSRYGRGPNPSAIGKSMLDMKENWRMDVTSIARLKWTLVQMPTSDLLNFLGGLSDEALTNLFTLCQSVFQIPLPEAAYAFALAKPGVGRVVATSAASLVFDRYPGLVKPAVAAAFADLAASQYFAPSSIESLINVEVEFKGYEGFLIALIRGSNAYSKMLVIERIYEKYRGQVGGERLIKLIERIETDPKVFEDLHFRFPPKTRECDQRLSH